MTKEIDEAETRMVLLDAGLCVREYKQAEDGTTLGDPVPGSRYFRSFCLQCGEAIRVTEKQLRFSCNLCTPCEQGIGLGYGGVPAHPRRKRPDEDAEAS